MVRIGCGITPHKRGSNAMLVVSFCLSTILMFGSLAMWIYTSFADPDHPNSYWIAMLSFAAITFVLSVALSLRRGRRA